MSLTHCDICGERWEVHKTGYACRNEIQEDAMKNEAKTELLAAWLTAQNNQAERPTPREQLNTAVARVEAAAYTRGLHDGLWRLEILALLVPSRQLTGPVLIAMAGKELIAAVREWQLKYSPNKD